MSNTALMKMESSITAEIFPYASEGQVVQVPRRTQRIACCSCGLTHLFRFRTRGRRIFWQAWRDEAATAALRAKDALDKAEPEYSI